MKVESSKEYTIKFHRKHFFVGDITIQIKEDKPLGKNLLINYVFNTAFVNANWHQDVVKISNVHLKELSPLGRQKLKNFGHNFEIDIEFRKYCECGDTKNIIGCQRCNGILKE